MTLPDPKQDLQRYLQAARDAMLWKLEGLSEYDVRRPLTPTGTNLLGLVKHLASVELGYFCDTFGRPLGIPLPWLDDGAELNDDMWATAAETRDEIVGLYRQAWVHADATIAELPLDTVGHVPWWPEERRDATLHHLLVRLVGETNRHAGHADIVRELIDGAAGWEVGNDNMPEVDHAGWEAYRQKIEDAAREAAG